MDDRNGLKPATRSRGMFRTALLVILSVSVIGGLAALGATYIAYDEATEIDRTYSRVVVRNYVESMLSRQDDSAARLYTCKNSEYLSEFRDFRNDIVAQEAVTGVATEAVLGALTEELGGAQIIAELQLRQASNGVVGKEIQVWRFTMVDEDGWRVCGATRAIVASPTPSTQPTLQ